MAEAQEGPPRKTTTYKKFSTMASQNERYNVKEDEFFWLENIMRTGPRKLRSVPGPGPQLATFPPPVTGCPADAPPANTSVAQAGLVQTWNLHVNNTTNQPYFGPPSSDNTVMSYGLITADETVYGLQKLYTGPYGVFGGYAEDNIVGTKYVGVQPMEVQQNVGKVPSSFFTFRYIDHPGSILFGDGGTPVTGTSDEQSYFFTQGRRWSYFSVPRALELHGDIGGIFVNAWAKFQNDLFLLENSFFYLGGSPKLISKADATTGAIVAGPSTALQALPGTFFGSPKATADFLYVLQTNSSNYAKIQRIDKTTLALVSSIDLSSLANLQVSAFDVVTDSFIYFVTGHDNVDPATNIETLWYWDGTPHRVGSFHTSTYNPTGWSGGSPFQDQKLTFIPSTRFLYLSNGGFSGFDIDILKIGPMECPS